jgi:hypothetical protein
LFQYFYENTKGTRCTSGSIVKHLDGFEILQTVDFVPVFQSKPVVQKQTIWIWNIDRIEDFNRNSSNLAAPMSLIVVKACSSFQAMSYPR